MLSLGAARPAAVSEREYGVSSDFASITVDFGDFSYMPTSARRLDDALGDDAFNAWLNSEDAPEENFFRSRFPVQLYYMW